MKYLDYARYESPIGELMIVADDERLCFLDFADNEQRMHKILGARYGEFSLTKRDDWLDMNARLQRYFDGEWNAFAGVNLCTDGTDFQRKVWNQLREIPPGKTISYSTLATKINAPKAIRAAGSANAKNPIAIVIPCHRVITADGKLGGYAGGTTRKSWLLKHEGATLNDGTEERT